MTTYVCAGCSRIRCKLNYAPWRPENWKKCPCGSHTIRPQTPQEVEHSRKFFKRDDKTLRRQRQLARQTKEEGFHESVFEKGHPFYYQATCVVVTQFEIDSWERNHAQRINYWRKYAEAI